MVGSGKCPKAKYLQARKSPNQVLFRAGMPTRLVSLSSRSTGTRIHLDPEPLSRIIDKTRWFPPEASRWQPPWTLFLFHVTTPSTTLFFSVSLRSPEHRSDACAQQLRGVIDKCLPGRTGHHQSPSHGSPVTRGARRTSPRSDDMLGRIRG